MSSTKETTDPCSVRFLVAGLRENEKGIRGPIGLCGGILDEQSATGMVLQMQR
jgi:hypothetical protein